MFLNQKTLSRATLLSILFTVILCPRQDTHYKFDSLDTTRFRSLEAYNIFLETEVYNSDYYKAFCQQHPLAPIKPFNFNGVVDSNSPITSSD